MAGPLEGKRIVLGVSGSIAAYKAADLTSRLVREGALVDVVLTPSAGRFISPLTFHSLTGRPVFVEMFGTTGDAEPHVEMGRAADAMVIAPATATMLGRLTHGLADEMVSLTALATAAPLLLAPAMDALMWDNPAVRANVEALRARGATFVGPVEGRLASGRTGAGRMAEPATIVEAIKLTLGRKTGDLAGRRIVVSAGGTREPLDPVRYVGNRSSGKMGYAIAEAARNRGAEVTLVTSAGTLPAPYGVVRVDVETSSEMLVAVREACASAHALVMAAAVADFRPAGAAEHKIKKRDTGGRFSVDLEETTNILESLRELPLVRVGFAAESRDLLANAAEKLDRTGCAFFAANDVMAEGSGFGTDTNAVTFVYPDREPEALPLLTKYEVGGALLDRLAPLLSHS